MAAAHLTSRRRAGAEPERGDPEEALRRVITATWRTLARFHSLVAINTATHAPEPLRDRHEPIMGRLLPLRAREPKQSAVSAISADPACDTSRSPFRPHRYLQIAPTALHPQVHLLNRDPELRQAE